MVTGKNSDLEESSTWKTKVPRGKYHNETESKKTVSLCLSKKLVERARNYSLNLSRVTENALNNILSYVEPQNRQNSSFLGEASLPKEGSMEPRAGFEPATSALPTQAFDEILGKFELFCGVDLQLSPVTVKDHSSGICRVLRRMQKEYCEVTKEDLRAYLFKFKQNHAPATVAGVIKTLRVFYRDFMGSPELVDSFKFPNIPYRPKIIPSRDDLQKFYTCLDSSFAEALFLFYASSGLRKCEVLSLNVNDIDFDKRMIVPSNHTGTTKCSYISFFNKEANEALNRIDLDGEKLFNVSDCQYKKLWKSAQRKSGLHITAKRLRDWFCCEMGTLGVSDRYIDAFCGRTPKSVLARHYTDYNPQRLKKIYNDANLKVLV